MISETKYKERIRNLSSIATKVFSAVPISEPWSMSRIFAEMRRAGGTTRDERIVCGCLNSLKEAGLIEEPEPSIFIRCKVRPSKSESESELVVEPKEKEPTPMPSPIVKQPRAPLAILSELATRCKSLADAIETAALEIDEYVAAKDVDAGKLKQLQALLKGLT